MKVLDKVHNFIKAPDVDYLNMIEDFSTNISYSSNIWTKQNSFQVSSLKDVPSMTLDPVIESCLSLLMETGFQVSDDQKHFWVESEYSELTKLLQEFHENTLMDTTVLMVAYNLLLWGNLPFKHIFDKDSRLKMVLPRPDFTKIIPVVYSNKTLGYMEQGTYHEPYEYSYAQLQYFKDFGGMFKNNFYSVSGDGESEKSLDNEFLFSPSYLSTASKPWKNVNIIEDSLILHRMDQSNYYRVISVDVGSNVTSKNSIKLLNFYRNLFKKVRRVSYDSSGMASKGLNQEFELVLPKNGNQSIEFQSIGGELEIRALKDLEVQYNKLFASLKVNPSMIGFSEDIPSSLGDSPAILWEKRLARTVKTLLSSTFNWLKEVDYIYLRSHGYNVSRNDWNYKTVSVSTLEDAERKELITQAVDNLETTVNALNSMDVPYNEKYLAEKMLGSAFTAVGVDVGKLFDVEETFVLSQSKTSLLEADMQNVYQSFVELDILQESELPRVPLHTPQLKLTSNAVSYQYLKGASQIYPEDAHVDFENRVRKIDSSLDNFSLKRAALVSVPVKFPVYCTFDLDTIRVSDIEEASLARISELYLTKTGDYVFSSKRDLINYIHHDISGMTKPMVDHLYEEK